MISVTRHRSTGLSDAAVGMGVFLIAEAMMFLGLVSAFIVLRSQYSSWPPLDQPRLPVVVTAVNTVVLLASGVTAWRMGSAARDGDGGRLRRHLGATALLGLAFLLVQGVEWARLVGFGLSSSASVYGGLFVTIVGTHAAHVALALVAVGWAAVASRRGALSERYRETVLAVRMFWLFVVGVWPMLYVTVYLW